MALEQELTWPANVNEVPREVFVRQDIFEEEITHVFRGPEWHVIGHRGEIPNEGDFKTFELVGIPLLIVRTEPEEVRVFYNACTHRANQLEVKSCGSQRRFTCPYHRWSFKLNGDLSGCPNSEDFAPGFKKSDYALKQPRTAEFGGLIFVTFNEKTPPILDWLEDIQPTLLDCLGGDGRLKLQGYQKVRYRTNWKAYLDNDGYHAPLLHTAFRMMDWQAGTGKQYATKVRGHLGFETELKPAKNPEALLRDPALVEFKGVDPSKGSRVVMLYPLTVFTKHADVINVRFANPISVDYVEVHYAYFSHEDDSDEMVNHRIRQSSNLVGPCGLISMEDASVFQRLHVGNHTPGNAEFQKGVKRKDKIWFEYGQNDESGNLQRWEYYRKVMGFKRAGA